jgi:protease-4
MVDLIRAQLKRAEEDDRVKAVILKVDSPGGEVLASDEINREIQRFQEKARNKPVVASMGSLAASGGYYVSAPCRWIVANDLTITGSIGVILSTYNYRGLMDKVGLVPMTFKSGKYKDMLSGSREPNQITEEERQMVQVLIDETYSKFKGVVQDGRDKAQDLNKNAKDPADRGHALVENWKDYADGRVLSGTEAARLGFVDELGNFHDAVKRARKLAGVSDANVIEYQQRIDLSDILRLFGKSDAKAVKVDLGMEMPKLQAGQLYFLSPTFLR